MRSSHRSYFLPYQLQWLLDPSRFKVAEKSRRIGMTYVQSYEDVHDAITQKNFPPNGNPNIYFSSADESAALEYITYVEQWTRLFDVAAKSLGEIIIDSENDIKAFIVEYANGSKIHALRSNPKAFRSKGGKVVLDEFAFHDDPTQLWKAAYPCIMWGYPIRVLSTHNGKSQRYFKIVDETKKKKDSKWSLHTTTIIDAVNQGLVKKVKGLNREATKTEIQEFLDELRESAGDEETWNQEFMCIPMDETTAFLTYEEIESIEDYAAGLNDWGMTGDLYGGMDIGRKKDLSVIWILERIGDVKWTRTVKVMKKRPFREQREELFRFLALPTMRRFCIDATGLGMQLAEEAQEAFGTYRVEAVTFTLAVKEELAMGLRPQVEDKLLRIPKERAIREDLHSIRKVVTAAGNIRFDASRSELGHADRFWSLALANHAAGSPIGPIDYKSVSKRRFSKVEGAW